MVYDKSLLNTQIVKLRDLTYSTSHDKHLGKKSFQYVYAFFLPLRFVTIFDFMVASFYYGYSSRFNARIKEHMNLDANNILRDGIPDFDLYTKSG